MLASQRGSGHVALTVRAPKRTHPPTPEEGEPLVAGRTSPGGAAREKLGAAGAGMAGAVAWSL